MRRGEKLTNHSRSLGRIIKPINGLIALKPCQLFFNEELVAADKVGGRLIDRFRAPNDVGKRAVANAGHCLRFPAVRRSDSSHFIKKAFIKHFFNTLGNSFLNHFFIQT